MTIRMTMFSGLLALGLTVGAFAEDSPAPPAQPAPPTGAGAGASQPSLDDLLDLPSPARPEREPAADEPVMPELEQDIQRRLSARQISDAFEQAMHEMQDVAGRLGPRRDAGLDTQRMQEDIIRKLDQIIAAASQMQQQQSSSSSSSSQQQQQARQQDSGTQQQARQQQQQQQQAGLEESQAGDEASDGQFSPGQAQEHELDGRPLEELRREWGNLPPRLRDELSQGLGEKFSPMYRQLTERYYRRLAESADE